MPIKEYAPGSPFSGVIGRTIHESEPAWPMKTRTRMDAPNVLFIVLDDTGFGHLGCYGSPIKTPNIDRLASRGLLFTNMHTTGLSSASRSCISNGRNHHSNGMACVAEAATGFPGSNAHIPRENGFLSEVLLRQGYSTFAVGKWHLARAEETSAAGPFDAWPLGRGFERYYGFLGGDTHQYFPDLVCDNHQILPPRTPEDGYHLTEDLADHAIAMIGDAKQVTPEKPFFLYFAPGAMHAPHHVPRCWIDRYRSTFDAGWDVYRTRTFEQQIRLGIVPPGTRLAPRDPDVAPWDRLPAEERRLYARMMEVFAGFLEHTDHQLGRVIDFLSTTGQLDNTLVMLISDNGASAEGGPHGSVNENLFFDNVPERVEACLAALDELGGPAHYNHYPWGWAWAGNTPFRRWKRETYRGGVSDPFIVHWPKGIKARGQRRDQYAHVIDIMPTVLDALQVIPPTHIRGLPQSPIEGVSFAHVFDDPRAPTRHRTQYFEMFGNRSIYHDGWRAVCPVPADVVLDETKLRELDLGGWELYNVASDMAETVDVAAKHPAKVADMIALWYREAARFKVLPLDARRSLRLLDERPAPAGSRTRYIVYPNTSTIANKVAPAVLNRRHSITARAQLVNGSEGVLVAQGGAAGGYSLYVKDHRLHYAYNYLGREQFHVATAEALPSGWHDLRFQFEPIAEPQLGAGAGTPAMAQLFIDGKLAGEGHLPATIPIEIGLSEGLTCGRDIGSVVTGAYLGPFPFTGKLDHVTIDVDQYQW